jgi:hypothetical protein
LFFEIPRGRIGARSISAWSAVVAQLDRAAVF